MCLRLDHGGWQGEGHDNKYDLSDEEIQQRLDKLPSFIKQNPDKCRAF